MKKTKLNIGDIFSVPLDGKYKGIGQIVAFPKKELLLIVIFEFKYSTEEYIDIDIDSIVKSHNILFLGNTLDAKLYHKHWEVIGSTKENIGSINLPLYKIGVYPDAYVIDYMGKTLREASIDEFESLKYQKVVAPIRFENALKAYYNLVPWIGEDYDDLLYKNRS